MSDVIIYTNGDAVEVTKAKLTNTSVLYMIGKDVIEEPINHVSRVYKDTTLKELTKEVEKENDKK